MSPKKSLGRASNVAPSSGATRAAARKAVAKEAVLAHAAGGMSNAGARTKARTSAAGSTAPGKGSPKVAAGHEPAEKPRVRDRILETAGELFYARGIHCVGVDSIATEAGTNKMSLYRNFPSKEELVAEYLREQEREYWAVWDATIEPFEGNPRRQLEALFDGFLARTKCKDEALEDCKVRRGCALGNAAVEIPPLPRGSGRPNAPQVSRGGGRPNPPEDESLRSIVLAYKSELRRRLRKLSRDAGASEPDALGDALMLLLEGGCYTLSTFSGTSGPIASMAKAARALISVHLRS